MKYTLIIWLLIIPVCVHGQRIGVNVVDPTTTLDVNGNARLRIAPDSTENYNYVNESGNLKLGTNFKPTRTIVAQDDGMLGYIDGLGITENPDYDYIKFTKVVTDNIDGNTPTESITEIGNIRVRLNATTASGTQNIQVAFLQDSRFGYFGTKQGKGTNLFRENITRFGRWSSTTMHRRNVALRSFHRNHWINLDPDPNVGNEDFFTALIVRYTAPQEVYRLSVLVNNRIPSRRSVPEVPSSVTIFIEQIK